MARAEPFGTRLRRLVAPRQREREREENERAKEKESSARGRRGTVGRASDMHTQ